MLNTSRQSGSTFVRFLFVMLLCLLSISVYPAVAQQGDGSRKIVSDGFTKNRKESTAKKTSPATRPRSRAEQLYRPASPLRSIKPTATTAQLGITIWRLRSYNSSDTTGRALIREKNGSGQFLPERVESDGLFREGDRLRLTIESPSVGYLYVINRELRADGTTGQAMLIYPWSGVDNHVEPGRLIDIPAQEDNPSYFTARLTSSEQTGELLTFIITPTLLDLPISADPIPIPNSQLMRWERNWGGQSERFELEGGAGQAWTIAEQQASSKTGRRLTREDPAPQTIYSIAANETGSILVNLQLKYR